MAHWPRILKQVKEKMKEIKSMGFNSVVFARYLFNCFLKKAKHERRSQFSETVTIPLVGVSPVTLSFITSSVTKG